MRLVHDNEFNGIYVVDSEGMILDYNRTFERITGINHSHPMSKSIYSSGTDSGFSGLSSRLAAENKTAAACIETVGKTGKALSFGKPIFGYNGNIQYIVNTLWDLTSDTGDELLSGPSDFITINPHMISQLELCMKVADTDSTILITGEHSVGKRLIASFIHHAGSSEKKPFYQLDCADFVNTTAKDELLWFTKRQHPILDAAKGGTLFLRNISEIPLSEQRKLLSLIQANASEDNSEEQSCVRIIASSSDDLWQKVQHKEFRKDLYYRLNVIPINIPPLRQRTDDILIMSEYFLDKINTAEKTGKTFSESTRIMMEASEWEGNVKELKNAVEKMAAYSECGIIDINTYKHFTCPSACKEKYGLEYLMNSYEKKILSEALFTCKTTRQLADKLLISYPTVIKKLRKHGMTTDECRLEI